MKDWGYFQCGSCIICVVFVCSHFARYQRILEGDSRGGNSLSLYDRDVGEQTVQELQSCFI